MLELRPHPNVVSLLGVCTEKNHYAIITEFLGGGSLDTLLYSNSQLLIYEALHILLDVAMGMAHIHTENVVHRDLAARNVLLTTERPCRAKIADFGLAQFQRGEGITSFSGAVRWMAPESLKFQTFSIYSDAWSFGILIYECMAREAPHKGKALKELTFAIGQDFITPVLPPHTPLFLSNLCRKCWTREPTQRVSFHQIITTVSAELDSFKNSTEVVPCPPSKS